MDDSSYRQLQKILKFRHIVPVVQRTKTIRELYRKISLHKLQLKNVYGPYLQRVESRIVRGGRIVLPMHEVQQCIKWHHLHSKGDCACKLHYRIAETYDGISKNTIQQWINQQPECSKRRPWFANKAPLRTITARSVNSRHQVDIVDMSSCADTFNSTTYKYILSVLVWMCSVVQSTFMAASNTSQVC